MRPCADGEPRDESGRQVRQREGRHEGAYERGKRSEHRITGLPRTGRSSTARGVSRLRSCGSGKALATKLSNALQAASRSATFSKRPATAAILSPSTVRLREMASSRGMETILLERRAAMHPNSPR